MRKPLPVIDRHVSRDKAAYSDYRAFRDGRISEAMFLDRLPRVALIGDSVSVGVHISSPLATLWRARSVMAGNWFLDTNRSPSSVRSVSKRLSALTPFVAMECAGIGAMIDGENQQPTLLRRVLGTRNLSGQVDEILRMQHFPDLVLILIGHNNVDWTWWTSPGKLAEPDGELQRQSVKIRRNFARELERLIRHAARQPHKIAIVVYGLINFGTYFNARRIAEDLRTRDPQLYPHLETTYRYMNSFRPGYRENLTRLATMVNGELRTTVDEINLRSLTNTKVHLRYSDAMATADLSRVEFLHAVDGWHPSVEGHNVLADGAFADMSPSLNFLGIC